MTNLMERFRQEARILSSIKSEHVVRVVDPDAAPAIDGAPYLVTELLEGKDFERICAERRPTSNAALVAIGALFAVLVLARAGAARAASPAEDSSQEGPRLLPEEQTDEACLKFIESYGMVASSDTLLNLALWHVKQGKTATAWNEYREAARLARNHGREDRASVADESAKALEANLARISITAVEAVAGLHVATEAGPVGGGGLKVDVPIDPGTHKVTATAPGHLPWTATLQIKEAEQVTLQIPKLEPEPLLPAFPHVTDAPNADASRSSAALYVGAGGVVLLAGGAALWSIAYSKLQSAKDDCTQGCSQADRDNRASDIQTLKNVAIGSWIVGGALVVGSGAYLAWHKRKTRTTAVTIAPAYAGLSIKGSF